MIEVEGLRKSYGDFLAVDGVSFTAQPGKIFGLLGPNGAPTRSTSRVTCCHSSRRHRFRGGWRRGPMPALRSSA